MTSLDDVADARNTAWSGAGLSRSLREFTGPQVPVARIDGRRLLLFSSSNYLGLATHPGVTGAARAALGVYGAGSGGSRLTTGTTDLHTRLERRLAEFFGGDGHDDAVFFATGYQANVAVLQTVAGPDVTVYSDSLNHASIIDGCRLARATVRVFPHGDLAALDRLLGECATPHALVVSDGVFSMDGDLADLPGLVTVAGRHGAWTMVDDAHGVGTLGETGRGSAGYHGVRPDILVGTASKALGGEGGFVVCSPAVGTLLRNQARGFVYSTAPSAPTVAAVAAAVDVLDRSPELVSRLHANVRECTGRLGVRAHVSPIIPVPVGDEGRAMALSRDLRERGFFVPAIRWPTVARGAAILRVTVTAEHTPEQIRALTGALRELTTRHG
ncbi:aminotransferase class I/II-fold pyridoxal phosphate-dependent enzyme [Corynebacterium pygosceleis]|uniref:8-amino-7-oxononanoate synthase n=1 Tax=Corynebacterium pygosceleis TaxID=2800406 RepID=A0A9Q4C9S1_9CORY|nr:8-amino-7-oxononanoate synthase [Corynebacterium pygosceleis]MCK7636504.1 8-amino-7-oxononanoate synthase [Corynebacterium pygosceleis]MCK7675078.1 8-amino-7-oxononanoate synthase [Corynebacterium pygosceleis]MCL0121489.1 8-amino-7-oxononanoate synthase [Corynebacterium pygosceleis]MCX7469182.1 8-amino-7-oxononanoate synthase [Corynebacterium pygosceleis]